MAEAEDNEDFAREQALARRRDARARLKSRLFLGGLFGGVIASVLGLFGYGIVYLSAPADPSDPELEDRLAATSQFGGDDDQDMETFDEAEGDEFAEGDEDGLLAFNRPVHRYFAFPAPFISNLHNSRKLITIELALATMQPPFEADSFVEELRKIEPVLRSRILSFLSTQEPDKLKSRQDRERLADDIRAEMNAALKIKDDSENPGITEVHILKLVVA
ncbi:MAG: flagellar basal body-associated FliL family protein [Candidatus Puniceispirillaceae bacterium]